MSVFEDDQFYLSTTMPVTTRYEANTGIMHKYYSAKR